VKHRLFAGGWSGPVTREIVRRGHAVGVLPYDPVRDEIVLIKQFRVGPWQAHDDPWVVETVAGIVENGEAAEDVARRESIEECGCALTGLHRVCDYYSSPGILDERVTLFCGITDTSRAGGIHGLDHEGEDIEAVVRRRDDAWADFEAAAFTDPKIMILLPWLYLNRKKLQS
jgi:ADP-ribose pyrophosphatase